MGPQLPAGPAGPRLRTLLRWGASAPGCVGKPGPRVGRVLPRGPRVCSHSHQGQSGPWTRLDSLSLSLSHLLWPPLGPTSSGLGGRVSAMRDGEAVAAVGGAHLGVGSRRLRGTAWRWRVTGIGAPGGRQGDPVCRALAPSRWVEGSAHSWPELLGAVIRLLSCGARGAGGTRRLCCFSSPSPSPLSLSCPPQSPPPRRQGAAPTPRQEHFGKSPEPVGPPGPREGSSWGGWRWPRRAQRPWSSEILGLSPMAPGVL